MCMMGTANLVEDSNFGDLSANDSNLICRAIAGDSKEEIPQLAPKSIDLVITSPPYFQQRSYGSDGLGNEEGIEEYLDNLLDTLKALVEVLKPTGNIVYNMGDKYVRGSLMLVPYRFALRVLDDLGLKLINDITWVKQNPIPHQFNRRLVSSTEPFFHFAASRDHYYDRDSFLPEKKAKPVKTSARLGERYRTLIDESDLTFEQKKNAHKALDKVIFEVREGKLHGFRMKINGIHAPAYGGQNGGRKIHMEREGFTIIRINGGKMKRDIIENPVGSVKGNGHPAIFPEKIIREMIRMLSPKRGVVLDHYVGSGTTLLAALKENRHCIGIDINQDYIKSSIERVINDPEIEGENLCLLKA